MKRSILFILVAGFFMSSCRSVEKMIDQGNFDTALYKLERKVAGKDRIKTRHVQWIEETFEKVTERDMARIELLAKSSRSDDWRTIISTYEKIVRRQEGISALLPIISKDGYHATFSFVRLEGLMEDAIDKHQELTYAEAFRYLEAGRQGNKVSAKKAYETFNALWQFANHYQDAHTLQAEAWRLGTQHIGVFIENLTGVDLDPWIEEEIKLNFKDEKWVKYHLVGSVNEPLDHYLTITLNDVAFSPERIREKRYGDRKEIEDGFEYVLDENGNVMKDSLGNDVKNPVFKTITARIIETHLHKSALLQANLIVESAEEKVILRRTLDTELVFEHHFAEFRGNRKALSKESRELTKIEPLPFPSNQQMFVDLISLVNEKIRSEIRRINYPDGVLVS